jgi:excisionase family DNA binding protein
MRTFFRRQGCPMWVGISGLLRDHHCKHKANKMSPPAMTLKDFCDAYRVCRETAYQQIRTGRLRAVKVGRKTLIMHADAEVWAASLPELRTVGREQASA